MSLLQAARKRQLLASVAWAAAAPVLGLWPFLSTLPGFSILSDPAPTFANAIHAVFLATGFWGVCAGWLALRALMVPDMRAKRDLERTGIGLRVGAYAAVWTAAYLFAAIAMR